MPKNGLFIGLMSGTSLDGIDAALVHCSADRIRLIATSSTPLPDSLRQEILTLCQPGADEINRSGQLSLDLGHLFSTAVEELLAQQNLTAKSIIAIGSHGQTVRHRPDIGFSLQLGSGDVIACRTGIPTMVDFRNHDMALGGQGAPLAPSFHRALFCNSSQKRAVLNIGGMANVSLLNGSRLEGGFDTGPGNVLLNLWAQRHKGQPYDAEGSFAASGGVLPDLLERFLSDEFFQKVGPKSTGREHFNGDWLDAMLSGDERPQDVQATLTELTVESIANSLKEFSPTSTYACGGGTHNTHLMGRLGIKLTPSQLATTEALDWHPDWVEAACFAWLAWARLNQKAATSAAVTGASRDAISGALYLP